MLELNTAMILQGHVNALCMVKNFLKSPGAAKMTLEQIIAEVEDDVRRAKVQEQIAYRNLVDKLEEEAGQWKNYLK